MPDTDGRALATEGRQGDSPNAGSMLILISAADNQTAGQAWPFDGCLQKPIDGEALARLFGSQPGRWALGSGRWPLRSKLAKAVCRRQRACLLCPCLD